MDVLKILTELGPVAGTVVAIWIMVKHAQSMMGAFKEYTEGERELRKQISSDCHACADRSTDAIVENTSSNGRVAEALRENGNALRETRSVLSRVDQTLIAMNGKGEK